MSSGVSPPALDLAPSMSGVGALSSGAVYAILWALAEKCAEEENDVEMEATCNRYNYECSVERARPFNSRVREGSHVLNSGGVGTPPKSMYEWR
jgi:hypothetical protein